MLFVCFGTLTHNVEKEYSALSSIEPVGPSFTSEVDWPSRRRRCRRSIQLLTHHSSPKYVFSNSARCVNSRLRCVSSERCSALGCSTRSLGPFQTDTNVAGHSIRPVDDLKSELVTERTKSPVPELVHLLRQAS